LKRKNPEKGIGIDPKWQRISWEEALDTIADKLRDVYETNPNQYLHQYTPTSGIMGCYTGMFSNAFGGAQNSGGGGLFCGNATHLHAGIIHGAWSVTADFDHSNYVIYMGASKGNSAGHSAGMMMMKAAAARDRGCKMVSFDPVCNYSGGKATEWISIIPGTDGIVLLAMINIILNKLGIYDAEYLKKQTNGPFLIGPDRYYIRDKETNKPLVFDAKEGRAKTFDDPSVGDYALEGKYEVNGVECEPAFQLIKEHVKKYTPEMASDISTVPAETIERVAKEFAEAASIGSTITIQGKILPLRPAAIVLFRGMNAHANSYNSIAAGYLLSSIVGANDVPGGSIGWPTWFNGLPDTGWPNYKPTTDSDGMLISGWWWVWEESMWPKDDPKLPPQKPTMRDVFPWLTTSPFLTASDREWWREKTGFVNRTKILIMWGANQILSVPNPKEVAESLKDYPFVVSFRLYLDEFSDFCDIVLPDCHWMEALFPSSHMEVGFNGPPGMTDWYVGIQQPLIEPQFERRQAMEVYMELARRVSPKLLVSMYKQVNIFLRLRAPYKLELDPTKNYTWEECCDRAFKSWAGAERGLEWFKEHGGISWPKKVEEAYFRPFIKNLRTPIYCEYVLNWRDKLRKLIEPKGIDLAWEHYTPIPEYFPNPYDEAADSSYDLYNVSYRDIAHTGSTSLAIPWIDEASSTNPYTYNIHINEETGKKKGLKDEDEVWLENIYGRRIKGRVKLMQGIHPQVVGTMSAGGHWSKNMPTALGKGVNVNELLQIEKRFLCPVSLSLEASPRLKIYKAREGE
jgi:molybdopterin-containing oxidoreductase family molybdopterin binding subunit